MGEAEKKILEMLAEGIIGAEEANTLLAALGPADSVETIAGDVVLAPEVGDAEPSAPPPNLDRFRRMWHIPVLVAVGSLLATGLGLALMYQSTEGIAAIGFLCVWTLFILALLATIVILLARRSYWLYVRVEEKGGKRFAFGLPVPLSVMNWGVGIARPFVPEEQRPHLETATAFVKAMKEDPNADPIMIDVDDEDGDKVQVYFG